MSPRWAARSSRRLYAGGNDQGYTSESAWNDGSGASGGGASQIFSKPDYQTGPGVPNDGARDVPDVSMMASPNAPGAFFGHDMSGTGQVVCCVGGTSLVGAAMGRVSRASSRRSSDKPASATSTRSSTSSPIKNYATAGFHDVTNRQQRFNGVAGFNAGPGYDQATGWGTCRFRGFCQRGEKSPQSERLPIGRHPTATATPAAVADPLAATDRWRSRVCPPLSPFPPPRRARPGTIKTLVMRNLSRTSALSIEVGTLAAPFAVSGAGRYSVAPGAHALRSRFFSAPVQWDG